MDIKKALTKFERKLVKAGISQAEAARRLNKTATHLNQVLRGNRRPSLDLLLEMEKMDLGPKAG